MRRLVEQIRGENTMTNDAKGGSAATAPADGNATTGGSNSKADSWAQFFKDLPASESKPLSGSTTVKDGAGYPGELVALSLLNDAVSSVVTAVRSARAERVLIVEDRALLDSDQAYLLVESQLSGVSEKLKAARAALPGAEAEPKTRALLPVAVAAVTAAVKLPGLVADLVGMFRTNYTMSSRTMTPDGTSLIVEVAKAVEAIPGVTVMVDGLTTVRPESSKLLSAISEARALRLQLDQASLSLRQRVALAEAAITTLSDDRAATRTSLLKVLESDKDESRLDARLKDLDQQISSARADSLGDSTLLASIDAAIAAYDAFEVAVQTAPQGGRSPLVAALARECLHDEAHPTHVLFVSIDSLGADVATPQSQLAKADFVRYFGGLQVSYLLYEVSKGRVSAAEVERRLGSMRLALDGGEMVLGSTTELR